MRVRNAVVLLAMLALLMPTTGCQKVASTFTPKPEVITQEATAAAAGAAVQGDLPEGLPKDLPLWPGASVKSAEVTDATQSIVLSTTEPYADVVAGVGVGFGRAGWDALEVSEEASTTVLEVSGPGTNGIVTISAQPGGATIEYLLTPTE